MFFVDASSPRVAIFGFPDGRQTLYNQYVFFHLNMNLFNYFSGNFCCYFDLESDVKISLDFLK